MNNSELESCHMNLNIWYDLPKVVWDKVPGIYAQMEGWLGFGDGTQGERGIPYWFSFDEEEQHLTASVEPSGLAIAGRMPAEAWETWKALIKEVASRELGFRVGEPEVGDCDDDVRERFGL